jgi:hypothetical protein
MHVCCRGFYSPRAHAPEFWHFRHSDLCKPVTKCSKHLSQTPCKTDLILLRCNHATYNTYYIMIRGKERKKERKRTTLIGATEKRIVLTGSWSDGHDQQEIKTVASFVATVCGAYKFSRRPPWFNNATMKSDTIQDNQIASRAPSFLRTDLLQFTARENECNRKVSRLETKKECLGKDLRTNETCQTVCDISLIEQWKSHKDGHNTDLHGVGADDLAS